jgi:hypothetical protein
VEAVDELNSGVGISSITVAGVTTEVVPQGIPRAEWLAAGFSEADMTSAGVLVPSAGDLDNATVAVNLAAGSAGATVYFAHSPRGFMPETAAWGRDNTFNLTHGSYVYIQVTAENQGAQAFYRVRVSLAADNADLFSMTVGGVWTGVGVNDGAANLADVALGVINLDIAFVDGQVTNQTVAVERADSHATVQFARVAGGSSVAPVWSDNPVIPALSVFDIVYVRVTASDGVAVRYYGAYVRTNAPPTFTLGIRGVNHSGIGLGAPSPALADAARISITRIMTLPGNLTSTIYPAATVSWALNPGNLSDIDWQSAAQPIAWDRSAFTATNLLHVRADFDDHPAMYHVFDVARVTSPNRFIEQIFFTNNEVLVQTPAIFGTGVTGANVGTIDGLRGAVTTRDAASGGNFPIEVQLAQPYARVTGFQIHAAGTNPSNATLNTAAATTIADLGDGRFRFGIANITNGQHLTIRVQAEAGEVWHYRIVVTANAGQ